MRYHEDQGLNLFSADERLEQLKKLGDPLLELVKHVDFEFFRELLEQAMYGSGERPKGGRPPFDPVMMLKVLFLQRLYNLSDDALEYQIRDRLSFMRFLGLNFGSRIPDAKTIWHFRNRLQERGLVQQLFAKLGDDLERRGIVTNYGKIVDASFVEAPRQRNRREENELLEEGETPPEWQKNPNHMRQKDVDARWATKDKEKHFGYKNHILCDLKSKLIQDYAVSDAAMHDSTALETLLAGGGADGQRLYGDSAYRSAQIEDDLRQSRIHSRIHEKAGRARPLKQRQLDNNKRKSKQRARVEHVFAFMTQSMGGLIVRAKSMRRNAAVIGLMNWCYNLCRVVQLKKKVGPVPA